MYVYILYNNFLDRSSGRYRFEQKMFLPIYSTLLYIDFDGQLILRFVRSTIQNRCYKISTSNIATFFFFFFLFVIILFSWTIIITFIVNSRALNRRVRASTIYRRVLLEISRILHLLIKRIIKVYSQGWLIWTNSQQVEKQESEGKISLIDAKLYYGHPLPILSDTRKFLHESFQKVIVRKELLLGHGGIFHVDRFRVVAEGRCLAENDERANDRCYSEDP